MLNYATRSEGNTKHDIDGRKGKNGIGNMKLFSREVMEMFSGVGVFVSYVIGMKIERKFLGAFKCKSIFLDFSGYERLELCRFKNFEIIFHNIYVKLKIKL